MAYRHRPAMPGSRKRMWARHLEIKTATPPERSGWITMVQRHIDSMQCVRLSGSIPSFTALLGRWTHRSAIRASAGTAGSAAYKWKGSPTARTETVDPLEFLARVSVHIPDLGQKSAKRKTLWHHTTRTSQLSTDPISCRAGFARSSSAYSSRIHHRSRRCPFLRHPVRAPHAHPGDRLTTLTITHRPLPRRITVDTRALDRGPVISATSRGSRLRAALPRVVLPHISPLTSPICP